MLKNLFGRSGEEKKPILAPLQEELELGEVSPEKVDENEDYWMQVPSLRAKHVVLTVCRQRATRIEVPATYDGKPVKELRYSFCGHPDLEEVVIPEGVEVLGNGVFDDCPKLSSVILPTTLRLIEETAFRDCPQIKTLNWKLSPDCVVKNNALKEFTQMYTSNGLLILEGTLYDIDLKKIQGSLVIPEEVKKTSLSLLSLLPDMDTLELPYACLPLCEESCKCLAKVKTLILRGTSLNKRLSSRVSFGCQPNKVVLWEGLEVIAKGAFQDCTTLATITLPQSLNTIEDRAFSHCTKLSEITIPKGVEHIEREAFEECEKLESVEFENEESIQLGLKAILYYRSLLEVPQIVIDGWSLREKEAFYLGQFLSWYKLSKKAQARCREKLEDESVRGLLVGKLREELVNVSYFGKADTLICKTVFQRNDLEQIILYLWLGVLEKIEHIDYFLEESIQEGNTEVTAMLLEYKNARFSSQELLAQEERAFELEMGIAKPTLKELEKRWVVTKTDKGLIIKDYIGKGGEEILPFLTEDQHMILRIEGRDFSGLKSLIIERGVIGVSGRFKDLESIHMPSGVQGFPANTFERSRLVTLVLPDSVLQLGRGFANRCMNLEEVELSRDLHTIQPECFAHCKELRKIVFSENLRLIGAHSFVGIKIKQVEFPASVTSIGAGAFAECGDLEVVVLPSGLVELGKKAFSDCSSLKKVFLPDTLDGWESGILKNCPKLNFVGYEGGKNLLGMLRNQGIV